MKVNHAKPLDAQDHKSLALWAADCAEHVLASFEQKRPEDDRPRKAIEAGRAWAQGEITMSEARSAAFAAHAAARNAGHAAATPTPPATRAMPPWSENGRRAVIRSEKRKRDESRSVNR